MNNCTTSVFITYYYDTIELKNKHFIFKSVQLYLRLYDTIILKNIND